MASAHRRSRNPSRDLAPRFVNFWRGGQEALSFAVQVGDDQAGASRGNLHRQSIGPLGSYRLRTAQDQQPLRRRASGLALALGVNLALLLALLTLGVISLPEQQPSTATVVDLLPEEHSSAAQPAKPAAQKPRPKPPPIALPVKPTIAPPQQPADRPKPWLEMSGAELAAADVRNLPKAGDGASGDSEEVGRGPHGEVLYAAEWARKPTDAELAGYLPRDAPEGSGLIACKTIPGNRVDDCVELGNDPPGSHLARAVRLAAWQFHVRPPRRNGKPMIGEWVRIRIDYYHLRGE
jgi:protein TonB